jgi:hypothetical protein
MNMISMKVYQSEPEQRGNGSLEGRLKKASHQHRKRELAHAQREQHDQCVVLQEQPQHCGEAAMETEIAVDAQRANDIARADQDDRYQQNRWVGQGAPGGDQLMPPDELLRENDEQDEYGEGDTETSQYVPCG